MGYFVIEVVKEKFTNNPREFYSVHIDGIHVWRWPSRRLAEDMMERLKMALADSVGGDLESKDAKG